MRATASPLLTEEQRDWFDLDDPEEHLEVVGWVQGTAGLEAVLLRDDGYVRSVPAWMVVIAAPVFT